MRGPEGLKAGQIVYIQPDLDGLEDEPGTTLETEFDTRMLVIQWPGGGFALVDPAPGGLWYGEHEKPVFFISAEKLPADTRVGYLWARKVAADDEWWPTQREAVLAAAEEEEAYSTRAAARAAIARRLATS